MIAALGGLGLCYVALSLANGRVWTKRGLGGEQVERGEEPFAYWAAVVSYAVVATMLLFVPTHR